MLKKKLLAGLTSAAVVVTAVVVAPTAGAVELEVEQRNGKDICVATLSDTELEETKDYFRLLIASHLELQKGLRALYPEYTATFEEIDARQAAGEPLTIYTVSRKLHDLLVADGFTGREMDHFMWAHSEQHRVFQDYAENGYPIHAEIAADWSKAELAEYPFGPIPVLRVGADWSAYDTWNSTFVVRDAQPHIPLSVFRYVSSYSWSNGFRPIYEPIDLRFDDTSAKFDALVGIDAYEQAAEECLEIVRDRRWAETPTTPPTTDPSTPPETPVPGTSSETAAPQPSDENTTPTTVIEPGETVTETAAPSTVTVTSTVTETAEPSLSPEPTDEENNEGSSSLPALGIFAAIAAALGGILAFLAPQLGIFTSLLQ